MAIGVPVELLAHLRRARDVADRNYAEPLDLAGLAAAAGVSKYHFLRCFAAEYGETPMQYVTRRRIERATDLLRATNLTVTEVCGLVGYSSLGSFSQRFTELVGMTPTQYQRTQAGARIPGCFVFMLGLNSAIPEKPPGAAAAYRRTDDDNRGGAVITNVSLVTVYVNDIDEAKAFYTDKLGFVLGRTSTSADFRWCTVYQADHPELRAGADAARPAAGRGVPRP